MKQFSFKDRFRYKSDQFFQSGFALQLVVSAVVLTGVISLFYFISEIFSIQPGADFDVESGSESPFWPSARFWWVIMHVLESYWIEKATFPQILSLTMTMFNLIVFAALIGLFSSRVQERLERVKRGVSKVVEEDHIIILGWTGKELLVMTELLEGLEGRRPTFVLHTEQPIEEIDERIKRVFNKKLARWVLRQGSLTDMSDLQLLNVPLARAVIILSSGNDAQVVKSIMAVAHLIHRAPQYRAKPAIVAEIMKTTTVRLAHAAAGSLNISIVLPAEHLSRIILQTARQHGLVNVYEEILSHSGNELHFVPAEQLSGLPWPVVVDSFPYAIPIGTIRDGAPLLSPHASDAAFSVERDDIVVCLARDEQALTIKRRVVDDLVATPKRRIMVREGDCSVRSLLLLGWNEKTQPLLQEYRRYAATMKQNFTATVVSTSIPLWFTPADIGRQSDDAISLNILREDPLLEGVLERVGPERFDAVILFGETEQCCDTDNADTKVIMLLLLLRSMRERAARVGTPYPEHQQIVSEILDPANKALAESTRASEDVIISNAFVSKMIAQISRDHRTELLLLDLFDEEGMEIYIKPSHWYADARQNMTFRQMQHAVMAFGETLIGIEMADRNGRNVILNPDKEQQYRIDDTIRFVVISENESIRLDSNV